MARDTCKDCVYFQVMTMNETQAKWRAAGWGETLGGKCMLEPTPVLRKEDDIACRHKNASKRLGV